MSHAHLSTLVTHLARCSLFVLADVQAIVPPKTTSNIFCLGQGPFR